MLLILSSGSININYESMILCEGDGAGDSDSESDYGDYNGDDVDNYGDCDDGDKQSWM